MGARGKEKKVTLLTDGSPAKRIVIFALPILGGELLHTLYTMIDAFILGRWLGINGLAAVGAGATLVQFIFSFIIGMTSGFAIVTTQRVGAGNGDGIRRSVASGIMLSLAVSAILMIFILPFCRNILTAMRTPAEILDNSVSYTTLYFSGIFVFMFSSMFTGFIHAGGDSFRPMIFQIAATVCKMVFSILFIVVLSMGVRGAAAASILADLLVAVLAAVFLLKKFPHFIPGRQDWCVGWKEIGAHLSLGIAMTLQRCIVEVGNLLVQTAMNTMGAMTIAAVSAAQRIRGLNMMPLFTLSRAVTVYTAQNYGAKKIDRVYRGLFQACLIALGLGVFMATLNQFTGRPLVSLFLVNSAEAVSLAHQYILFTGYTVFILGIMLVFRSALQGLGMKTAPILCGVMETVMSILAAFVLIPRLGFLGVCLVNPLSWLASGIPLYIAFGLLKRKLDKKLTLE